MKTCNKCFAEKPEDGFYSGALDCKECRKVAVRANRLARSEYYRAYDRGRAKAPERVKARADYAKLNPRPRPETDQEKRDARVKLGNALRDGKVFKPPECQVCATPCKPHGHHHDYRLPLDVVWMCTPCHATIHAYMRAIERNEQHAAF